MLHIDWQMKDESCWMIMLMHKSLVINGKKIVQDDLNSLLEFEQIEKLLKNIQKRKNIILEIKNYLEILNSRDKLLLIIKNELLDIKNEFSTPRLSEIIDKEYEQIDDINYIQKEDIIITISNNGYIKRTLLENYRAQNRGGKGKTGMSTREEDFVKEIHLADTHTKLLVFSSYGKVYALKSHDIPEASLKARGKPIINLLPFTENEKIATFLPLPIDETQWNKNLVVFITKNGMVRKNKLIDVAKSGTRELRETGKLSIKLNSSDELISVKIANNNQDIFLSTSDGKCLRFPLKKLRLFSGLNSGGVRGIKLDKNNF